MGLLDLFFRKQKEPTNPIYYHTRAPIRGLSYAKAHGFQEKVTGDHIYLEAGDGKPILFCPGLFGSIYNFGTIGQLLSQNFKVILPYLPLYHVPLQQCTIQHLGKYLKNFIDDLKLKDITLIGSSMGGGTILNYVLIDQSKIKGIVLCGSSGLSTIPMQTGYFRRKEISFVKKTTQDVFYDPTVPSDDMIKEVFDAIQNYDIVLRSIRFTKSTAKDQLHNELHKITIPTLVIWGKQDKITPPEVGYLFKQLLPDATLHMIDQCGHIPTQEHPELVYKYLKEYIED